MKFFVVKIMIVIGVVVWLDKVNVFVILDGFYRDFRGFCDFFDIYDRVFF